MAKHNHLHHKHTHHKHHAHHNHGHKKQHKYTAWQTFTYKLRKWWRNPLFKLLVFAILFVLVHLLLENAIISNILSAILYLGLSISGILLFKGVLSKILWVMVAFLALGFLIFVINPVYFICFFFMAILAGITFVIFIIRLIMIVLVYGAAGLGFGFGFGFGHAKGQQFAHKKKQ